MAYIGSVVLDGALNVIRNTTENLYICNAEPATFAQASSTYRLGTRASPAFTGPGPGDVSGRKITVNAITDGAVTVTDTATHWALTDDSGSALLAAGALAGGGQVVTAGNTFTLGAFDVEFPAPA